MELLGLGNDGRFFAGGTLVSASQPVGSPGVLQGIKKIHTATIWSLEFIVSSLSGAYTGNWKVEASNNFVPTPMELGAPAYVGDWVDVTALFTPSLTAAVTANGLQLVEPTHVPNGWKWIRVTQTQTGGTSAVFDVVLCGKE